MKVSTIGAEVQFTKSLEDGSYKKVCLSAEAQLEDGEDRSEAHRALYGELAEDLKAAFSNNGKKKPAKPSEKPQDSPKVCPINNVKMKRWEKNGQVWYSHKVGKTWCRG